jgi:hypothetical protein
MLGKKKGIIKELKLMCLMLGKREKYHIGI